MEMYLTSGVTQWYREVHNVPYEIDGSKSNARNTLKQYRDAS